MFKYVSIGKKIYDMSNPREKRRLLVFVLRAKLHESGMKSLLAYFESDVLRQRLIKKSPFPLEQATRSFFYRGSTFAERSRLIREHISFLQSRLQEKWFMNICNCYGEDGLVWQSDYEGKPWQAVLKFETGQRKEGLLSLELNLGQEHLYQLMFWFARDKEGNEALWIGAMQGPNMAEAREIIKKVTKHCFGYRTKNLILYMVQAVARTLEVKRIYAVTNYGYYANNHMRADRKLKTNFEAFWAEAGGWATKDRRFYGLPLAEPRKSIEEVKTHKRNLYRKRFALLDAIDAEIESRVSLMLQGKA